MSARDITNDEALANYWLRWEPGKPTSFQTVAKVLSTGVKQAVSKKQVEEVAKRVLTPENFQTVAAQQTLDPADSDKKTDKRWKISSADRRANKRMGYNL